MIYFPIPSKSIICVYGLFGDNGKIYIGSTSNLKRRIQQHNSCANSLGLQGLQDRYQDARNGVKFKTGIIKRFEPFTVNRIILEKWEFYYQQKYNTIENGYNKERQVFAHPTTRTCLPIVGNDLDRHPEKLIKKYNITARKLCAWCDSCYHHFDCCKNTDGIILHMDKIPEFHPYNKGIHTPFVEEVYEPFIDPP